MKNFGKYFLVIGISLVSFLGSYLQKGAKRNLNHIGHSVQNHDFRDFAGSARAWRNNYFNYKNSEEKEKELGKNNNEVYREVSSRKEMEKEAGENNNEVNHEVKTEKPKTSEQICKEKCLVWLDPQERKDCLGLCMEKIEEPLPFKSICQKNCLAEPDPRAKVSCLNDCKEIWGE